MRLESQTEALVGDHAGLEVGQKLADLQHLGELRDLPDDVVGGERLHRLEAQVDPHLVAFHPGEAVGHHHVQAEPLLAHHGLEVVLVDADLLALLERRSVRPARCSRRAAEA